MSPKKLPFPEDPIALVNEPTVATIEVVVKKRTQDAMKRLCVATQFNAVLKQGQRVAALFHNISVYEPAGYIPLYLELRKMLYLELPA